jgi:hypothetical protein
MTVATLAASSPTPAVLRMIMSYIGRRMPLTPQRNVKFHKTQGLRDYETLNSVAPKDVVQVPKGRVMEIYFAVLV